MDTTKNFDILNLKAFGFSCLSQMDYFTRLTSLMENIKAYFLAKEVKARWTYLFPFSPPRRRSFKQKFNQINPKWLVKVPFYILYVNDIDDIMVFCRSSQSSISPWQT